ncbi:peptidase family C78-domain-containing protein [Daldinia bambusicola]|nr:peptidase family C78-domain-containing protein [Daldinia bambusicola]
MRAPTAAVPGPSRAKTGVPAGVPPSGLLLGTAGDAHVKPSKSVRRLGKKELGAYYNEERMPRWLEDLLKKRGFKSSQGVIPVLAQLLQQNKYTQYAYLCHPETQHISKLRNEGSFCGYRNIQMMISYIVNTGAPGAAAFNNTIPSIFQIQDLIEKAWDRGIHEEGRIELGSLRGTRKYIGTPEAQTLLASLDIRWDMQTFKNMDGEPPSASENRLYDAVEEYFATAPGVNLQSKVRNTKRPPIYLQHQGHSMTIIGIERQPSGNRNLLVFDPSYSDPANVTRHVDGRRPVEHSHPDRALKLYRRGPRYFSKYHAFELMRLKE